jgi:hypothetical protein
MMEDALGDCRNCFGKVLIFLGFLHLPSARVVCLESKRQPAVRRKHCSVPTGRVVVVEVVDVAVLPSLLTGSEDVEVVAVQIYRLC